MLPEGETQNSGDIGGDMAKEKIGDIDHRQLKDIQASADAIPVVLTGLEKNAADLMLAIAKGQTYEIKKQASLIIEGTQVLRRLIYG